jgi:hypothetical protein
MLVNHELGHEELASHRSDRVSLLVNLREHYHHDHRKYQEARDLCEYVNS